MPGFRMPKVECKHRNMKLEVSAVAVFDFTVLVSDQAHHYARRLRGEPYLKAPNLYKNTVGRMLATLGVSRV